MLIELYRTQKILNEIPTDNISNAQLIAYLPAFNRAYDQSAELLSAMKILLQNSITSTSFTQTTINGHIAVMN